MCSKIMLLLTGFCLLAGSAVADSWYVGPGGSDLNPGTFVLPFATIQHGIDTAVGGDEVLVLAGTYTGAGNWDLDTGGKAITVRGVDGAASTTINGGGTHDGFSLSFDEEDSNTVIEGLTVTNAVVGCDLLYAAPKLKDMVFDGASTAGVRFQWDYTGGPAAQRLVVDGCGFQSNTLGVYSWVPSGQEDCELRGCTFDNNTTAAQGLVTMYGCAVTGGQNGLVPTEAVSRQTVVNCDFTGVATTVFDVDPEDLAELTVTGGSIDNCGVILTGHSIESEYIDVTLSDCDMTDNGGGIDLSGNFVTFVMEDCVYQHNDGVLYDGSWAGSFRCTGCTIVDGVPGDGLVVSSVNGTIEIGNNIIAYNLGRAIAIQTAGAGYDIHCNDLYGNNFDYVFIPDQTGLNGNISQDPLFCDLESYDPLVTDLALDVLSPCTTANSTCGRMGALDEGCGFPVSGVWYVATTGDDTWPGTLAEPFRTIGHGVATAADGDTVCVLDGRYVEHVAIDKPLTLFSQSRDTTACTIEAPVGFRVITVTTALDTVHIDGFELTGGNPAQGDVGGYDVGGGIFAAVTPLVVRNCHIHDNVLPADQSSSAGGGIHVREGSYLRLVNSKVADNWAPRAGGICIRHQAGAELFGNVIVRNGALRNASGLWILPNASTQLPYVLVGNTVAANTASLNGSGATFDLLENLTLEHNIFAHNACPTAQVGLYGCQVAMDCNLVYPEPAYFSDLPYDASGNVHLGPRFCDLAGGDFRLNSASPAAPTASQCGLIGALGIGCDPVSTVGDLADGMAPPVFELGHASPNPFNPQTTIVYRLPRTVPVELVVYNLDGRRVRVLKSGVLEGPGRAQAVWRGRDDQGRPVATGLYIYRLQAGEFSATRKVMLLK